MNQIIKLKYQKFKIRICKKEKLKIHILINYNKDPVRDINSINFACICLANMASTGQKYILYDTFIVYYYMYKYDIISSTIFKI